MYREPLDAPSRRHQPAKASLTYDRLPPHSLEAEQGVLGCIFLSRDCVGECIEKFSKIDSSVFYDLRHQKLYETMCSMYQDGCPIDQITVQQKLKDSASLEAIGGLGYLASLPDVVPSAANLGYYIDTLLEKYRLRKIIQVCTSAVARVFDNEGSVDQLLDEVETSVMEIASDRVVSDDVAIKELVHGAVNQIEALHQANGLVTGLQTGFVDLDRMIDGLHPQEFVVIAARPSVGKTSLAMNIVEHLAVDQKIPVGVFSLEMSAAQLTLRMVCSRSRVNLRNIRDGLMSERDFPKITGGAATIARSPIHICDRSGLSVMEIRARARRMVTKHGVKAFVVDYLQLCNPSKHRGGNRNQEVSDISAGMKALAKELNVPVIVLSQLSRDSEKDKKRVLPRLSDLRESGSIEQDADTVILLFREETDDDRNDEAEKIGALVAKQRNGPVGIVHLTFLKAYTRFESACKLSKEDEPDAFTNPVLPLKNDPSDRLPYYDR